MNLVPKKKRSRSIRQVAPVKTPKDRRPKKVAHPDVETETAECAELVRRRYAFERFLNAAFDVAQIIEKQGFRIIESNNLSDIDIGSSVSITDRTHPGAIQVRFSPEGLEGLEQLDPCRVDPESLRLLAAVHLALSSAKKPRAPK